MGSFFLIMTMFSVTFLAFKCSCATTEKRWKDYTYKELTNSFYKMHKTNKSWIEAKKICESEGALLFYPDNFQEAKMIRDWWAMNTHEDMTSRVKTWIHVGLTDMYDEDHFETVDGIPISEVYNKWLPSEPNNYNNEDCVDILYNLELMDSDCNATERATRGAWDAYIPFVCKKKLEDSGVTTIRNIDRKKIAEDIETKTIGGVEEHHWKDYTYKDYTKSFYKMHNTHKSWLDAKATCESEGAILFYPESVKEAQMVRDWWLHITGDYATPYSWTWIHVGFSDLNEEHQFKSVDGRVLLSEVYNNWRPFKVQRHIHEHCVALLYDLQIIDGVCNATRRDNAAPWKFYIPFACKKKLNDVLSEKNRGITSSSEEDSGLHCSPSNNHVKKWRDYTNKGQSENYYKIHSERTSWLDAKAKCESEEALLFYPDDLYEAAIIRVWWGEVSSDNMKPKPNFPLIHIGISDYYSELKGDYETVDGIPIQEVYHLWGRGEPNNAGGVEHCGQLCYNLTVNDARCDGKESDEQSELFFLPFVCKKKLNATRIETNYRHSSKTGSCYSLQLEPLNWLDAEAACAADHAHLAIINSQEEADFLVQMVAEAPTANVTGDFLRGIVHLGFHTRRSDYWETVTGQHLLQAGYAKWGNQQPDGEGVEKCGSMFPSGRLNDVSCDAVAFYICERESDNYTDRV